MLKCVSDDGFEDAARRHERPLKVAVLEGAAAVRERLIENGPKLHVVHELESAGARRGVGRGGRDSVHAGQRRRGLPQDVENPVHNLRRVRLDDRAAFRRSDEKRTAERAGEPVRLVAAGELVDRRSRRLLPGPGRRQRGCSVRIGRKRVTELTAAASQILELTDREVPLRAQGVIHGTRAAAARRSDRCGLAWLVPRPRRLPCARPPPRPRVP